jgi:hypothetical protein
MRYRISLLLPFVRLSHPLSCVRICKVRGFTYGVVEGRSPDRCALAAACGDTLAQIEAIWYETFWKERHFHYRKLLASQERTILTLLYFRWKRPTIADALHYLPCYAVYSTIGCIES